MNIWKKIVFISLLVFSAPTFATEQSAPPASTQLIYASALENALVTTASPLTVITPQPVLKTRISKNNRYSVASSCVEYAHQTLGIKQSIGYAKNQPINSKTPVENSIVVTTEGKGTGHLAIVTKVEDSGIYVKESNYVSGRITSGRFIAFDSGKIKGYYTKE